MRGTSQPALPFWVSSRGKLLEGGGRTGLGVEHIFLGFFLQIKFFIIEFECLAHMDYSCEWFSTMSSRLNVIGSTNRVKHIGTYVLTSMGEISRAVLDAGCS